jgi:hypothetical protein
MFGDGSLHAFQIALLQNRLAASPCSSVETCDAMSLITTQPVVDNDFAASHDVSHFKRAAALTFEQDHLAAPPKGVTVAMLITLFQRHTFIGAQLDLLDASHDA